MPRSLLSYTYHDYSLETANITIKAVEYNAGSYVQYLADIGEFRKALFQNSGFDTGVCWGQGLTQEKQTLFIDEMSAVPPTDENILRGRKWAIKYQDNVTFQKYTCHVPCANPTGLLMPNSDRANLSATAWQTFKTAFEAVIRSPYANDVTILSARLVGRKL